MKIEVLCFKAGPGILDTSNEYMSETVSYGTEDTIILVNGLCLTFKDNCIDSMKRIDERNLV